jgi:uncharacterized protein (DUF488 family)
MEIYTIGFTQRSAEEFFDALAAVGTHRIVDVRLKNESQLSGFTRKRDLPYFLGRILGAEYRHELMLAPTDDLLSAYRKGQIPWKDYEAAYLDLIGSRRVDEQFDRGLFEVPTVLLCSETKADRCHRRLVAEHFVRAWPGFEIVHL